MRIKEAVKALAEGKVIHCPNSFETMEAFDTDFGKKVKCSLVTSDTEVQNIYLSRLEILYRHCDFGLGQHPKMHKPSESKPAAATEKK